MADGKRDACTCSSLGSEAVVADFLGAGRPSTPGAPCSVSRRQHRAVGAPQSGHPQRLVGSSWFSKRRRPCWPGGRLPSPSGKRTSTTVRVSVPIRFSERPPGLRRIFSPFIRPSSILLASFTYAVLLPIASFTYAVSLPTVDEGLKLFDVVFFHHRSSKKRM